MHFKDDEYSCTSLSRIQVGLTHDLMTHVLQKYIFVQPLLDHMRVSAALNAIGHKLRSLSFLPKENLHNIVEFQVVMNR